MENYRINSRVIITVNKRSKLLGYLRKLNSGEIGGVNVRITYAFKVKPIKLSFLKIKTPTKTSDDFLVYAEYRSSKSSSKVVLGNASIKNIQESGFVSIGNKEAKECVIINTYSKNDSPDFREFKKVLLDIMKLEDYTPSNCTPHKDFTNSTILVELKPENSKIISYEVSIAPAVKTGKAPENTSAPKRLETITVPFFAILEDIMAYGHLIQYVYDYKVVFKIRGREFTGIIRDIETQDPIAITSSSPRISPSDIKVIINISITLDCSEAIDNLFKEIYPVGDEVCVGSLTSHLLKNKPGILLYTTDRTKYKIISYPKPTTTGRVAMAINKMTRENLSRALETTTGDIPTRKLYPISDYFPEMPIKTIDNKIKTNLVSFSCSIPNIFIHRLAVKDNNSIDTENLSAIFEIGNKVFNGTIVRASIDTDSKIVGFPLSSHISTMVSLEILIDNDSKKIIQNLLDKTDLETAAVGKLMLITTINDNINHGSTDIHKSLQQIGVIWVDKDSLLKNNNSKKSSSTVTESEKGTQEILKQRHNTDSKKSNNNQLEIVVASSMIKSDLKKPLKKWRKILEAEPIEILAHIHLKAGHVLGFYIRESTFGINGVVVDDKIIYRYELVAKCSVDDRNITSRNGGITISGFVLKTLRNAYIKYKQRKSENLNISHLESLLEKNQKTSNQKRDKDLISIIAEALREIESIGKANISKSSKAAATEDLFCKKAKVNSERNNNTTRPYQALNPLVSLVASDESKDKIKEIIEEANRAKSFPYKLDYSNNCVVKISDNLFDILECRNKLEDMLKIRKDINVGIFTLEPTDGLVLKKIFNISSLTIYHSASKNLYALIGA